MKYSILLISMMASLSLSAKQNDISSYDSVYTCVESSISADKSDYYPSSNSELVFASLSSDSFLLSYIDSSNGDTATRRVSYTCQMNDLKSFDHVYSSLKSLKSMAGDNNRLADLLMAINVKGIEFPKLPKINYELVSIEKKMSSNDLASYQVSLADILNLKYYRDLHLSMVASFYQKKKIEIRYSNQ